MAIYPHPVQVVILTLLYEFVIYALFIMHREFMRDLKKRSRTHIEYGLGKEES